MHDDQDINANLTIYVNFTTGGVVNQIVVLKGQLSFEWTLPEIEANDVIVNITVIDSGGFKGWSQSGPFTIKAPPSPPPDFLNQYWWLIIVIVSLVVILVLFLLIRKKRRGDETPEIPQQKPRDR
jgi:cytochrome bd-type quinol oxidase subunit 2